MAHLSGVPSAVSLEEARALLAKVFGLSGEVARLSGEHDSNFEVVTGGMGGPRFVLKVHAPATDRGDLDCQNQAMRHVAARDASLGVPLPVRSPAGDEIAAATLSDGSARWVRLLTWLPGATWAEVEGKEPALFASLGRCLARMDRALADFEHPNLRRRHRWAMQFAPDLRPHLARLEPERRALAGRVLSRFEAEVLPRLAGCRPQAIHGDANEHNVLVGEDLQVCGVIDFGDLSHSPPICNLAVGCAYAMLGRPDPPDPPDPITAVLPLVSAYDEVSPLADLELALLFDLIQTRLAMSLVIAAWQHAEAPGNGYLLISQEAVLARLERLASENCHRAHFRFRNACGREPNPDARAIVRWIEDRCAGFAELCRRLGGGGTAGAAAASAAGESQGEAPGQAGAEAPPKGSSTSSSAPPQVEAGAAPAGSSTSSSARPEERRPVVGRRYRELVKDDRCGCRGDPAEADALHLGVDILAAAGEPVFAPLAGRVRELAEPSEGHAGAAVLLEHALAPSAAAGLVTEGGAANAVPDRRGEGASEPSEESAAATFWTLYAGLDREVLQRLAVGMRVERDAMLGRVAEAPSALHSVLGHATAGAVLGRAGDVPPHLHFQLLTHTLDQGCAIRGVAPAGELAVWESISPDPNLVLGLPAGASVPAPPPARERGDLARERRQRLGRSLSLSYDEPLQMVRGSGQFLFDERGRRYLDMVNNVCHVGHCHPRVVRAGQEQMARLNTNTRYLNDLLVTYARRLTATLPESLRVCFFVNSGSEANDLALRLARTRTGRRGVLVLAHSYHGNLSSLIEISPYKFWGPGGGGRLRHVRVCELPDPYRGRFKAEDAACGRRPAEDALAQIERLHEDGEALAAFFAEPAHSCGGHLLLPPGYLATVYEAVRSAGGVCVADEVQVGLGRCGSHMWAFEPHGVVPDILTLGKPLGNGHPLAAVVTTAEIAASFDNGMEYFNTFGGNPVSAAIGLAVLDVIRDERLRQNAWRMGCRLLDGMRELATRQPLIGDVRGLGLFLGIELVRDRRTLEPAAREAALAVESAKRRGVLLAIEGPHHNVLKIKPPIAIQEEHCELFLAVLEAALAEAAAPARGVAGSRGLAG